MLESSLINSDVKFSTQVYGSVKNLYDIRKGNLQVTQFVWITLRPVVDQFGEARNPKTPILLFKN